MKNKYKFLFAVIFGIISLFGVGFEYTSSPVYAQSITTGNYYWVVKVYFKESESNKIVKHLSYGVYKPDKASAEAEGERLWRKNKTSSQIFEKVEAIRSKNQ